MATTPAPRRIVAGQTGDPLLATQLLPTIPATPTTPTTSAPAEPASRPRQRRWAVLLRTYLLATLLLLGLVVTVTPAPAEPLPTYRLEVIQPAQDSDGAVDGLAGWALRVTAWATIQAAERQRDLLQANPLDIRVFAPVGSRAERWVQAHRMPVELTIVLLTAGLVFFGVLLRPARRWWQPCVLLLIASSAAVNFPQAALTLASAPGLSATRQVANFTGGGLLPDAARAERAQAQAAEGLWTRLVTDTHSRLAADGSNILSRVPAGNRSSVLALLHQHGVKPADGLQAAFIATSGLISAAPWVVWVWATSLAGTTSLTLTLLLMLAGPIVVPALGSSGRWQTLRVWWLLPLGGALTLTLVMALASIGLTWLLVAAATTWDWLVSLLSGSAVVLLTLLLVAWRARGLVRRWRQHPPWTSLLGRSTPDVPTGQASAPRRQAGAA